MTCSKWASSISTTTGSSAVWTTTMTSSSTTRRSSGLQVGDELVEIERLQPERLPATDRQELTGQVGGAGRRPLDLLDKLAPGIVRVELVEEQRRETVDDRQHVVEVVGDATRQLSDRVHLLRLAQARLEVTLGGDIADVAGEHRRARLVDPVDRDLDRDLLSIRPHGSQLDTSPKDGRVAGGQIPGKAGPMALPEIRRHEDLGQLLPDDVIAPVTECPLCGGAELGDAARVVHDDDRVDGGLEHRALASLARAEGFFDHVSFREVENAAFVPAHVAVAVPDASGLDNDPANSAVGAVHPGLESSDDPVALDRVQPPLPIGWFDPQFAPTPRGEVDRVMKAEHLRQGEVRLQELAIVRRAVKADGNPIEELAVAAL